MKKRKNASLSSSSKSKGFLLFVVCRVGKKCFSLKSQAHLKTKKKTKVLTFCCLHVEKRKMATFLRERMFYTNDTMRIEAN